MGKPTEGCGHSDCDSEVEDIAVQVENAIKALPTLQEKVQAIAINGYMEQKKALDDTLEKEINKIDLKYRAQMQPFFDKINAIVEGTVELKDEDFEGVDSIFTQEERDLRNNHTGAVKLDKFWFKVLQNDIVASSELRQCDEPILNHLKRIEASKSEDETRLTVKFHFEPNDYFNNAVITKQFQLEGDEIKKSFGDAIEWKEGKNVTVKIVKKKNKNKKTGEKVTKTKQVKEESFFNFFNAIEINSDDEEEEDEEEGNPDIELLEQQYELAQHIYEELIPYSLQTYLGVNSLDDFGDLGDIEELDDEEEEQKPKKKHHKKSKGEDSDNSKSKSKSKSKDNKKQKPEEKPECKQQ